MCPHSSALWRAGVTPTTPEVVRARSGCGARCVARHL